jgi:uncharacterized membrane protein
MFGMRLVEEKEMQLISNKLSVLDLLTVRILLNYNRIFGLSIFFLICSLFSFSFIQALGTVGFLACSFLILYIQIRFAKIGLALLTFLTMVLTSLEILSFWIK